MMTVTSTRLGKFAELADSFAKVTVGVVSISAAFYLAATDKARECSKIVQGLYEVVSAKHYDPDAIDTIVSISEPGNCEFIKRGVPGALKAASSGLQATNSQSPSAQKSSSDSHLVATPFMVPSKGNSSSSVDIRGWVAVGFLDSSDVNFDSVDGKKISSASIVGSTLKAKLPLNVRPGPAAWNAVSDVLGTGQCFKVESVQALSAGNEKQTWANGKSVICGNQ